ncbi:MAG TPA: asparagine synthase (glutamine-hydrolyzing), partial [Usitatibacter sp.]|nr:asparagine synthase (glutamine-hydrolyzing) [Usitatibacter sp.]
METIRERMASRGPDGAGSWFSADGRAALAHRRLSIIDLTESGAQPMVSADGRLAITFNGEIYNFRELRSELAARGARFRSTSDTEVLLHLYAERGAAMVESLRGMFAFAIRDERDRSLFLARDPFGIKPLYYADDGATLRFASQVKALMAGGAVPTDPEPAAHVGFFVLGSVPEPFTMYRAVKALPAGHTLTIRDGRAAAPSQYFDLAAETLRATHELQPPAQEAHRLLSGALRDSVRQHMIADVPVGLFLSSGLDSNVIAALACEVAGHRLKSITLGFEEYRGTSNDETPLATLSAAQLGTEHATHWITRDAFEAEYERLMESMDQPSIDGVNTYFVSKAAADAGMKVALSGLGGDELFGGYPSFSDVPRSARAFGFARWAPWLGTAVRRMAAPILQPIVSPKYASLLEYGGTFGGAYLLRRALHMPWEVERFLDRRMFAEGWESLDLLRRLDRTTRGITHERQRVAALELAWYMRNQLLRDADWAGMAHSLEIRIPLVDPVLFRQVMPLLASPRPPTKLDAARTLATPLPGAVLSRPKTGFSIPVHQWARKAPFARGPQRQLRNWAHVVHGPYKKLRVLALLSDAFGGHGGIALYNRDLLTAVCSLDEVGEVVALPRVISQAMEPLPPKLSYRTEFANGKVRYVLRTLQLLARDPRYDMVICCHVNLLPISALAKARTRSPLMMFIYGIDAWEPIPALGRSMLRYVDRFVSISDVTRRKFTRWSAVGEERITILPNAIHTDWYGAGSR